MLTFVSTRLSLARRFIKFCFVGGTGAVVDMGILFFLADPRLLGLNITFSKICAAELAMINNFIWNELWTFRRVASRSTSAQVNGQGDASCKGVLRSFLLFNAICGIGIALAVLLLHLFHARLGWNLYLSNFLAVVLVTFWNFGINALELAYAQMSMTW